MSIVKLLIYLLHEKIEAEKYTIPKLSTIHSHPGIITMYIVSHLYYSYVYELTPYSISCGDSSNPTSLV